MYFSTSLQWRFEKAVERAGSPDGPGSNPSSLPLTGYVTLGPLFNLPVFNFPHLENGDGNSLYP